MVTGVFLITLTLLGFVTALPNTLLGSASLARTQNDPPNTEISSTSQLPQAVGADAAPSFRQPRTVVSSIDSLLTSGVLQSSPDNITIYSSDVKLRLLGGTAPRDELLGPKDETLSSNLFWGVQVNLLGLWTQLSPTSNTFTIETTNSTGAFVQRTMNLSTGNYTGSLRIFYSALSQGPLKWSLQFVPTVAGHYRIDYSWPNIVEESSLSSPSNKITFVFGVTSYTFDWSDVPGSLPTAPSIRKAEPNLQYGNFDLSIDLGPLPAGRRTYLDPSLVSTSHASYATAYSFQRKVFYDPKGGYYFVFYADSLGYWYRSSGDGLNWSASQWVLDNLDPSLYVVGDTIVMAYGGGYSTCLNRCYAVVNFSVGSITGPKINWSPGGSYPVYSNCPQNLYCNGNVGDVGVTVGATGKVAVSFDFTNSTSAGVCQSTLYVWYTVSSTLLNVYMNPNCIAFNIPETIPSAVVPSSSDGTIRLVYEKPVSSGSGTIEALGSIWLNGQTNGTFEPLDKNVAPTQEFSLVSTSDYRVQVVWKTLPSNTISYAYRGVSDSAWMFSSNILSGTVYFPTLTADYSTNDVDVFAVNSVNSSILMRQKTPLGNWNDTSITSPVRSLNGPYYLDSDYASASATNSSMATLIWTTRTVNGLYNVTFASIPIQTVWSPYADPSDPWDGNGVAPYGQYFTNLGESVSPSTGMLSVSQTDLSLTGRGMDLTFRRIFTEPVGFATGQTYNYENYPWAPMGNGWQIDFPWMENVSRPQYIHLWNGEGYRIPSSFWTGNSGYFENHQGEDFAMQRYTGSVILTTKSGSGYSFDASHRLTVYQVGTPTPEDFNFYYDSHNHLAEVTDEIGRTFYLNYNTAGLLSGIAEIIIGRVMNSVNFAYSGSNLISARDILGRTTTYQYLAVTDPVARQWLISRITYPTNWYTNYTYAPYSLGTEVLNYRVVRQFVGYGSGQGTPVRQFYYVYTPGPGDQVVGTVVSAYNGTGLASYTSYAFSFLSASWNVSDVNHNLLRGYVQQFGVHGEPETEITIVTDNAGGNEPPGSYTTFNSYDLWGNLIYTRQSINPSTGSSKENYNAYYNDGLPPSFNFFQDTFSQEQGTVANNLWHVRGGSWIVNNGSYNGTETNGDQANMIASADTGNANLTIQASVYIYKQVNATSASPRVGLFAHYNSTSAQNGKWAAVLVNTNSGPQLELRDEWHQTVMASWPYPCSISQGWYNFKMTVNGQTVTGEVARSDGSCDTSTGATFPADVSGSRATGFGFYAGGYSALFDNVTVTPAKGFFSNQFYPSGAPSSTVHNRLAGSAELQYLTQNPTGVYWLPEEIYYNYTSWGSLNQIKQLSLGGGIAWVVVSKSYDQYGNLVRQVDPRGNSTAYGYSSPYNTNYQSAYLTSRNETLIPGNILLTSRFNYNFSTGLMTSSVDPNGYNTLYGYDSLGRVTRLTFPTGDYQAYSYNDTGNYVDITNENGWKTREVYDGLGRLITNERFLSGTPYSNETTTYWNNRVASNTDALGNVTIYWYDALGRPIATLTPDGTAIRKLYNDTGSWTLTIDQNNVYTCNVFDRLGRLVSVVEYSTKNCHAQTLAYNTYVTNYYYDLSGNLLEVATANGQTTSYSYDNLNRLVGTSYPDKTSENYSYDSNGNIVKSVDRKTTTTSYLYDSLNRAVNVTYTNAGGGRLERDNYTYDGNGNPAKIASLNATLTISYDGRNRLTNELYQVNPIQTGGGGGGGGGGGCIPVGTGTPSRGANGHPCSPTPIQTTSSALTFMPLSTPSGSVSSSYSVSYSYQGENLAVITYPGTLVVNYGYDGLGRVMNVTQGISALFASFSYDKNSQPYQVNYGNGVQTTYSYDKLGRTSQITTVKSHNTLLSLTYSYNSTGTVANVVGSVNGATVNEQYRYDPLGRLTNATVTSGGTSSSDTTTHLWYEYDNSGNRIRQGINSTSTGNKWITTRYGINPTNNELLNYTSVGSTAKYGYDLDGGLVAENLTTTSNWKYDWNAVGNLLSVTNNTGVQGYYSYDGHGRRVEAKEGSATTFYAYLGMNTLSEILSTGVTTDYIYANGLLIAKFSSIATTYYHSDTLGSTRLTTDSKGNVVYAEGYQPFGLDNGTPSGTETYKFTGKPVSQTTGLYYDYQRWYDPTIGRFISQDPLAGVLSDPQSLNPYLYVENLPTSSVDPTGMADCYGPDSYCQGPGGNLANNEANLKDPNLSCTDGPRMCQWCADNPFLFTCDYTNTSAGNGDGVSGCTCADIGGSGNPGSSDPIKVTVSDTTPPTITETGQSVELLDPNTIRFTQDSVSPNFQNGQSITDLARGLESGAIDPTNVKPIRVVEYENNLYSLDNRRLVSFQAANTDIPAVRVPFSGPYETEFLDKYSPIYQGLKVFIRGVGIWPPNLP